MLIQACNVSKGDEIITSSRPSGGLVEDIEVTEDGTVRITYAGGGLDWLESPQIVVRKDKFFTFFTPDPVQ